MAGIAKLSTIRTPEEELAEFFFSKVFVLHGLPSSGLVVILVVYI
jgi:hypothetical protein